MVKSLIVKKIVKTLAKKAAGLSRKAKAEKMNYDAKVLKTITEPKMTKTIVSGSKNKPRYNKVNVGPLSGRKTSEEFRDAVGQVEKITKKAAESRQKSKGGMIIGKQKNYIKDLL
jgi:hypothetical protein